MTMGRYLDPPKFGDLIRNTVAAHDNPQRDGFYVRFHQRTGRTDPGTFYEITDGHGNFWSIPSYRGTVLARADREREQIRARGAERAAGHLPAFLQDKIRELDAE
jgi:hypothetical protein